MSAEPERVVARSWLAAPPATVWQRVVSYAGINDELRPWLRMTAPPTVRERGLDGVELGRPICRSWVLAFGVLPIDYDNVTIVELDPGRGFLERSPMGSQRFWEHRRTIAAAPGGCELRDELRFIPRLGFARAPARALIGAIFAHRHRRLRRHFGGRPPASAPKP